MEAIIENILKQTKGYDCHIILSSSNENLTRFGDNEISQNVSKSNIKASVRIISDKKAFKFTISNFDKESIKNEIKKAKETLKFIKEDENTPFSTQTKIKIDSKKYYDEETSNISPQKKAKDISNFLKFCKKTSKLAYGTLSTNTNEIIIANSVGLYQKAVLTNSEYEITVNTNGAYGKAHAYSKKYSDINFEETNNIALKKSELAQNPVDIKPGKYTVILEPLAIDSFFYFFGYLGFNALAYYEKRSFANDNIGKKIFSEKLTIIEDPIDFPQPVLPFDLEGMPRERVILVEKGILKNIVTDKKTSKLTGLKYTGHSLFEPNPYGAVPVAISIEKGTKTFDKIISETDRAILVTEFHYTNPLKYKTLEITGMTRNGTYLIENGKIKRAVKNLRFTQNMVEAMNNIEELSTERTCFQSLLTPAFKIKDFNFTSTKQF